MSEVAAADPYAGLFEVKKADFPTMYAPENVDRLCRLQHDHPVRFQMPIEYWRSAKMPNTRDLLSRVKARTAQFDKEQAARKAQEIATRIDPNLIKLDLDDHYAVALKFLETRRPHLIKHAGQWLDFKGNRYVRVSDDSIYADLFPFMRSTVDWRGFQNKGSASQAKSIMHALGGASFHRHQDAEPPTWLQPQPGDIPPDNLVSLKNGLLNITTGNLVPHDPRFFTYNGLDFDYVDQWEATAPKQWLAFLEATFQGDRESIDQLQEVFGYLVVNDNRYQVFFNLIGQPRSGKGTIGRILHKLVGEANTSHVDPETGVGGFGMQDLVGKQLLLFSDLIVSKDTKFGQLASFIQRLTGQDAMNIQQKFKDDWKGTPTARIFMITNGPLTFQNHSGAIAARMVALVTYATFEGDQDADLTDKLMTELPLIFNWALDGLVRLRKRGKFATTVRGSEAIAKVRRYGAPLKTFLQECCDLGQDYEIPTQHLIHSYNRWEKSQGLGKAMLEAEFGKNLETAAGMAIRRRRKTYHHGTEETVRTAVYAGVRVKPSEAEYLMEKFVADPDD